MPESFVAFLREAVAGATRDAPACMSSMAASLGVTRVVACVDDEVLGLWAEGERLRLSAPWKSHPGDHPTATVTTTSAVLLRVLDGRQSLLSAVTSNEIRVCALPADGACLFHALRRLVEGIARSGESVALYERFRKSATEAQSL